MPLKNTPINELLLDRDGTIIEDKNYLADPDGVALLPGAGACLGRLAAKGMRFFLVSNQSGIGRGYFAPEAAQAVNRRMAELLQPFGVRFAAMLFCPHKPEEDCACRKPGTGMWLALREKYGLDPTRCLMVGDKQEDMRFGAAAELGGRALVLTGKGGESAAQLGLAAPASGVCEVNLHPPGPAYPHLLLPSLAFLEEGIERLLRVRAGQ